MLLPSRGLQQSCLAAALMPQSLTTWVPQRPLFTCDTPATGGSTEETTGSALVFFTEDLSSTTDRALSPFLTLGSIGWSCPFLGLSILQYHGPGLLVLCPCRLWAPHSGAQTLSCRVARNTSPSLCHRGNCVWSQQMCDCLLWLQG